MRSLGATYRFTVLNDTGQTIAGSSILLFARRVKLDSSGALVIETAEATILSSGATLAQAAYLSGTTQDNTTLRWQGGDFHFKVTAPASSDGNVILFFERSTDGGSTWDTNGLGQIVAVLNFTTSGTKTKPFSI